MPDIPKICVKKCVIALDWVRWWELFSFDFYFSVIIFVPFIVLFYIYIVFSLEKLEIHLIFLMAKASTKSWQKKKKRVKLKFIKELGGGKQNEIGYWEEKKFCFKIAPSIDTPWWHSMVMLVTGKWIKKFNMY